LQIISEEAHTGKIAGFHFPLLTPNEGGVYQKNVKPSSNTEPISGKNS
jgi:hypothetical protein